MNPPLRKLTQEEELHVSLFMESLWVEDSNGLKLPRFSPEEVEAMAIQRLGQNKLLQEIEIQKLPEVWGNLSIATRNIYERAAKGSTEEAMHLALRRRNQDKLPQRKAISLFRTEWNKLPMDIRHQAKVAAAARKLARPIEELLEEGELGNAYTVRGKLGLLKWAVNGEMGQLQQATELLESAANNGDTEACSLLASYSPRKEILCDSAPEFLIDDEDEREDYFDQAVKAGYEGVYDELQWRDVQHEWKEDALHDSAEFWRENELKELEAERRRRESMIARLRDIPGRTDAQELTLGKLLREKVWSDFDRGAGWNDRLIKESRVSLGKASSTLPEARYELAFCNSDLSDDMILDLYHRAAYPQDGALPYRPAFNKLARAHIKRGSLDLAEKTLRDQLAGLDKHREIEAARCELAKFLHIHSSSSTEKETEALEIFLELSDKSDFCAYSAALILVKRGDDEANLKKAKDLLLLARKGEANRLHFALDSNAAIYAKIAYRLGWGRSMKRYESVVEMLLGQLEKTDFSGDDEFPMTPVMASVLMSHNANLKAEQDYLNEVRKYCTDNQSLMRGDLTGIYGVDLLRLIKGLVSVLQSGTLEQEAICKLFGSNSLVSEYVKAQLIAVGRFNGGIDAAIDGFQRVFDIVEVRLKNRSPLDNFGRNKIISEINRQIQQRILDNSRREKSRLEQEKHRVEGAQKIAQEKEKTHKQTLSFLTHTLNNALSTGPETVRTVIDILGSDLYDKGPAEYKVINNMASLLPTFLFAENLLKTFQSYVSDPELVREKWKGDKVGDANVSLVIAMAVRQSVARLVFSSNHLSQLKRLMPSKDKDAIKNIRKSFVDEIIPLEITVETASKVFDWIKAHFSVLHIDVAPDAEMSFTSNATRYMFLFAAFSELIYNALKYSDAQLPILVKWFRQGDDYCLSCANSCQPIQNAPSSQEGTNKGLFFIEKLMSMLEDSGLNSRFENGGYRAVLQFGHTNFEGNAA